MFTERVVVASGGHHAGVCYKGLDGKNTHWFYLFDTAQGKLLSRTELKNVSVPQHFSLSPDGSRLAVSEMATGAISVWSLSDGQVVQSRWKPFPGNDVNNSLMYVTLLDSNRLLTFTTGRHLDLWNLQGQSQYGVSFARPGLFDILLQDPYTKEPKTFAFSPDRSRLVLFNGTGYDLIDTATGQVRAQTKALVSKQPGTSVYGVGLDKDGSRLAVYVGVITLPNPAPAETIFVWDFKANQAVGTLPIRVTKPNSNGRGWGGNAVSWWGTDQLLVWGGNGQALLVDAATGKPLRELEGPQLGGYGFGDTEGRIWYNLVTQSQSEAFLCAVDAAKEEAKREPLLDEGKYYKRWWLTRNGIEAQSESGDVRGPIFPRVGPAMTP